MIDFRALLEGDRCWDAGVQEIYERTGEPAADCILQNREELIGLCEFIEETNVRSYLEVGAWTGRLVSALHRVFDFDLVATADDGYARRFGFEITLPPGARYFEGDSASDAYRAWRAALGPVDLVLIDANHGYRGVARDFAINRAFPHRYLAFHDITGANRHTRGVARFWNELATGAKREIVCPHAELGLDRSAMGIGIWSESEPL